MKHLTFLTLFALTLFMSACDTTDKSKTVKATNTAGKNRVEVIDFYGKHRCMTCKAIEANTKYTIDTYFSDQQKDGQVVFKTVNVDEEANYAMAENFEAAGTALFINVVKNGQEHHIDLTDFGFTKGTDKETFSAELKNKINKALKDL